MITFGFVIFVLGNGKDSGKFSGRIVDSDMHDVGRFLNRLLGLPPEIQNRYVPCHGLSSCMPVGCTLRLNIFILYHYIQALRVICQHS